MPIHFRDNQYQGINAHLQSALQSPGGDWEVFHAAHITYLTELIDTLLPDNYYVLNEKSLQLSTFNLITGDPGKSRTRPDLSIFRNQSTTTSQSSIADGAPVLTLPIVDTIYEDDPLNAVVIYQAETPNNKIPVTRIELLSPGNKPGGAHYQQYITKRHETLENSINLIEIDYLHESRSPARGLPSYPDQDPDGFPYTILVSNPHPSINEGRTDVYGYHVDQSLAPITIPLAESDTITVDFGVVYNITFARNRYYGTRLVDYEQLPARFETYTSADRQRIQARLDEIRERSQ